MTQEEQIKKILIKVLEKIKPSLQNEKKLKQLSEKTLEITNQEASAFNANVMLTGSLERGTWLPTKNEFDVFIIFPKDLSEQDLEKHGLEIGKKVIEKLGGTWKIEYAQHPYVRGNVDSVSIDIVPCYKVESGDKIKSAVDRTPFHVEYLNKKLSKNLTDEVRLLKQFLKTGDMYGADTKTQGLSGYICELLVINYGRFVNVLQAVLKWNPKNIVDIENYYDEKNYKKLRKKFKDEILIVIDPVDKNRNAASAVSAENLYKFKKKAKEFLQKPTDDLFFEKETKPLTEDEFKKHAKIRGTELIVLKFQSPDVVQDILWPQLRRAKKRLEGILSEYEFKVMRSDCWANEKDLAIILLELEMSKLSLVNKRVGPFVFDIKDSENFIKKYEKEALVGPFIEENNWCVEIKREHTNAKEKLLDSLKENEDILKLKGIPNYIAEKISKGFQILDNEEIIQLIENNDFAVFLRKYFEKEKLYI